MVEADLQRLLEDAVNTSCKLAIVMQYAEHADLSATPTQVSQRLCRDIGSIEQALDELAHDGILTGSGHEYQYGPNPRRRHQLRLLIAAYDEPLCRQEIMSIVADLDRYAPYRDIFKRQRVEIIST